MADKKHRKKKRDAVKTELREAITAPPTPPPPTAAPNTPSFAWLTRALFALEDVHKGRRVPQPAAEFVRLQELLGQVETCYLRLHTDRGESALWTAADLLSTAKELQVVEGDFELAARCRDLCDLLKKQAQNYAAAHQEPPCPPTP